MRLFCYLLCIAALGLAAFGCSKAPQDTAKADSNAAERSNTNPTIDGAPSSNVGTEGTIPGVTGPPADANQAPQKPAGPNPIPARATVAQASRPAPDDSTFTSRLTDVAVETRTFRKHPQLLKVEKTIALGKQTIKIYLRNGNVIDLPGDRINSLSTIPAADIIALIGTPADTKVTNPGDTQKKSSQ